MEEQKGVTAKGGTMRLGGYPSPVAARFESRRRLRCD